MPRSLTLVLVLSGVLAAPPALAQDDPAAAVLAELAARKGDVSLVAYRLDDPEGGVYHHADLPRPLASTVKISVLAAYAQAVEEGRLDADERVPLDSVAAYYLPGTDGGAHPSAMDALRADGRLDDEALALDDVAWAMTRFSDNAATDYLLARLGRATAEAIPDTYGLLSADPPLPISGIFLAWDLPRREGEDATIGPNTTADRAWWLANRLRADAAFRDSMQVRALSFGQRLSYDAQAAAALSFPAASARDYADLMARLYRGEVGSEAVSARMLAHLDWPMGFPGINAAFDQFATKGGALPGILTSAYLAEPKPDDDGADRAPIVLALFIEGLPAEQWGPWAATAGHQAFEFRLLTDPDFLETVRAALAD